MQGAIRRAFLRNPRSLEKVGIAGALRFGSNVVRNDAPSALMTLGIPYLMGPKATAELAGSLVLPNNFITGQPAAVRRHLAAVHTQGKQMKTALASAGISREDLERALSIKKSLEKTAGIGSLFGKGLKRQNKNLMEQNSKLTDQIQALKEKLDKAQARRTKLDRLMDDPASMFLGGAALTAGAMATGTLGMGMAHAIGKGSEGIHRVKQNTHYRNMLKADPSLKRDPKSRAYFNVLHKASPYMATEPYVAAATVRSMIDAPEGFALRPENVKGMLEIEEKRQKTRYPGMRVPSVRGELPDLD